VPLKKSRYEGGKREASSSWEKRGGERTREQGGMFTL